jgi:crotonobetainyl-CoA:carnitine CoA-transferase CaiB-like acyl-CoA transferase
VPALGAHSVAILAELGFSSTEIQKMKAGGIIHEA